MIVNVLPPPSELGLLEQHAKLLLSCFRSMEDTSRIAVPHPDALPPIAVAQAAPSAPVAAGNVVANGGFQLVSSFMSSQLSTWKDERLKTLRPISEFTDKTRFAPPSPTQIFTRLKTNLFYFQSNYVAVFLILAIYCAYVASENCFSSFSLPVIHFTVFGPFCATTIVFLLFFRVSHSVWSLGDVAARPPSCP